MGGGRSGYQGMIKSCSSSWGFYWDNIAVDIFQQITLVIGLIGGYIDSENGGGGRVKLAFLSI